MIEDFLSPSNSCDNQDLLDLTKIYEQLILDDLEVLEFENSEDNHSMVQDSLREVVNSDNSELVKSSELKGFNNSNGDDEHKDETCLNQDHSTAMNLENTEVDLRIRNYEFIFDFEENKDFESSRTN